MFAQDLSENDHVLVWQGFKGFLLSRYHDPFSPAVSRKNDIIHHIPPEDQTDYKHDVARRLLWSVSCFAQYTVN